MFDQITSPRNAREAVQANRTGRGIHPVPPLPINRPSATLEGEGPAGPTNENRTRFVHFADHVSQRKRRQQAAELRAYIVEKVEGAETGRDAGYVREIACRP